MLEGLRCSIESGVDVLLVGQDWGDPDKNRGMGSTADMELSKNTVNKGRAGTFFHHIVQSAKERGEPLEDTIEF